MWIDDLVLEQCAKPISLVSWVPKSPMVVLGRSNKAQAEVELLSCKEAGVPILKRIGGGGTVVLYPGCLVLSAGLWVKEYFHNDRYFALLNQSVIEVIQKLSPQLTLSQRGFSDIVIGDKKCAGTSLFRSRNYLLYQVSLLIELDVRLISLCLKHPSREPDYRQRRSHQDFLVGLGDWNPLSAEGWRDHFLAVWEKVLMRCLPNDLVDPVESQVPHVLSRVGESYDLD